MSNPNFRELKHQLNQIGIEKFQNEIYPSLIKKLEKFNLAFYDNSLNFKNELNDKNLAQLCTLLSLVELINDHTSLNLNYADLTSFQIWKTNLPETRALLEKSLKVSNAKSLVTANKFQLFLDKLKELEIEEQVIFTVKLCDESSWPKMLTILAEYTRSFFPVEIENSFHLVIASFSIKNLIVEILFEKQATIVTPFLGKMELNQFLQIEEKGERVVSYDFPHFSNDTLADLNFSGLYFFTEHDWSHIEESSFIPQKERKLFARFNLINVDAENVIDSFVHRIFLFGDLELTIYKFYLESNFKKISMNSLHQKLCQLKYPFVLFTLFEVLGLPMGFTFKTLEALSLEKDFYGFNSDLMGEIKVVEKNCIKAFEQQWYALMDVYIKKLLMSFVNQREQWITEYEFDPEMLDWELNDKITHEIFISTFNQMDPLNKKITFAEIKFILKKFAQYYEACKKLFSNIKDTAKFSDPLPHFTFKFYEVSILEFHVGRGIRIEVNRDEVLNQLYEETVLVNSQ